MADGITGVVECFVGTFYLENEKRYISILAIPKEGRFDVERREGKSIDDLTDDLVRSQNSNGAYEIRLIPSKADTHIPKITPLDEKEFDNLKELLHAKDVRVVNSDYRIHQGVPKKAAKPVYSDTRYKWFMI